MKGGSQCRLLSRNEKDFGSKFPEIMESASQLDVQDAILDGEIVALYDKGRSSFQLLQAYDLGFETLGLASYAKTSGSKGLQVYIPLNTAVTYERTKAFARTIAIALERLYPEEVISRMERKLRKGKVFMDWSQNDDKKTTVTVYSLRAKDEPTVSTPVTWSEVERAAKSGKPLRFGAEEVLRRVEKHGDLFAAVLETKQKLPPLRRLEQIFA